jgi:hypothetical protein
MTCTQKWLLARVAKSDPIWHDNCISIILKLFKSPPEENAPQLIPQLVGLFYDRYGGGTSYVHTEEYTLGFTKKSS